MAGTVLIVEDDPDTVEIVRLYLRRDSYEVLTATNGHEGLRLAREARPDLMILDLMLPGMDGTEICRTLREEGSDVPIIMLTARVDEEDRLTGLDLGADDYVTKPFSPREPAARARAVLRRIAHDRLEMGTAQLDYENVNVDLRDRAVNVDGNQVHPTPIEFRLLLLLMRHPGRTFTRNQIIDQVFGYDFDGFDRTVDAHISHLRSKMKVDANKPSLINSVYGV